MFAAHCKRVGSRSTLIMNSSCCCTIGAPLPVRDGGSTSSSLMNRSEPGEMMDKLPSNSPKLIFQHSQRHPFISHPQQITSLEVSRPQDS